ncbi:hypothetical protein [Actinoplanes sp. NPDC023714]|uniref:hypothetical protein n=1 Tax=Actinoplanes sp. NPDC023714 TaxID=3154322 RepID=UPI0033F5851A
MRKHPCLRHKPGQHDDACLTGPCGFCGTSLQTIASGECRECLRIMCESCDTGYQVESGPLCGRCTPVPNDGMAPPGFELRRDCLFSLDLSCGHVVLAWVTGFYPVSVPCCDRLGGTIRDGRYVPFVSAVDYARLLFEHYELQSAGSPPDPTQVVGRQARTSDPYRPAGESSYLSTGRFPARVGAALSIDGSIAVTDID